MKSFSNRISDLNKLKRTHISIIGLIGVGKTTLGKELAKSVSEYTFVDIDEEIEKLVDMPIHEFVEKNGIKKFREFESAFISKYLLMSDPQIISSGGGAVLDEKNRINLRAHSKVVWLDKSLDEVTQNCLDDDPGKRPLLNGQTDFDGIKLEIEKINSERVEFYRETAHVKVNTQEDEAELVKVLLSKKPIKKVIVGKSLYVYAGEMLNHYPKVGIFYSKAVKEYANKLADVINAETVLFELGDGEEIKNFDSLNELSTEMMQKGFKRNHAIVGVGGGTITDLVGFLGAVYMRGIDAYYYPTTILAQVDASIGGKTGVDTSHGKNLLGTFTQPVCTFCDTNTLSSLPQDEYESSLGEIIKYGLIGNEIILNEILESKSIAQLDLELLIEESVKQKLKVVSLDEFEQIGVRAVLNFGHTLAHALEKVSKYSIPHGKAVSIGSFFAVKLMETLGYKPVISSITLNALQRKFGLDCLISNEYKSYELLEAMKLDKKSELGLTFVFYDKNLEWFLYEVNEANISKVIETLHECYEASYE